MLSSSKSPELELQVRSRNSTASLTFHEAFSSPEANVVLAAKHTQVYFLVHSHTLKTTSGFFRTMYNLPQSINSQSEILYLEEEADVLECLLRMICGLPFSEITSQDFLESVLFAAEKYDMPGPMSIIKMCLLVPSKSLTDSIRLYALACRYNWKEEAKALSTCTLSLNIHDPSLRSSLQALSADALLDLFALHRLRRDEFRRVLDGPPFIEEDASVCGKCEVILNYTAWRELKYKMFSEIDCRPLGDTVVDKGLFDWPEAQACWRAECPNSACKRQIYDRPETIRMVRDRIEGLPKTI